MIVNIDMRDDNDGALNISPLTLARGILNTIEAGAGDHCLQQSQTGSWGIYQ